MREPLACRSASAKNAVACRGLRVGPSKVAQKKNVFGIHVTTISIGVQSSGKKKAHKHCEMGVCPVGAAE